MKQIDDKVSRLARWRCGLRWTIALPIVLLATLVISCDFPAEPPLRSGLPPDGKPVHVDLTDSARSLLPLAAGNRWLYVAIPVQHGQQPATYAITKPVRWNTETLYEIQYAYLMKAPVSTTYAFPGLLQMNGRGITLYERTDPKDTILTRPPKLAFTLPYPAAKGASWADPQSDYTVQVVTKDTLLRAYNTSQYYRCYQYDVEHRGRKRCSIFAIPGSAFLRIEYADITFHTVGWSLQ